MTKFEHIKKRYEGMTTYKQLKDGTKRSHIISEIQMVDPPKSHKLAVDFVVRIWAIHESNSDFIDEQRAVVMELQKYYNVGAYFC
jgi:hypothetical protein